MPQNRYTALYRPAVTATGAAIGMGGILALAVVLLLYRRWRRRQVQSLT
jgi:hypothetical protein